MYRKNSVSVRIDGIAVPKLKQLFLCNVNQLFVKFKESYPCIKIGGSKFSELPLVMFIAEASGTHTVCMYFYHKNLKLIIEGAKLNLNCKDLIEMLVYDTKNYNCMISECENCGGDSEEF